MNKGAVIGAMVTAVATIVAAVITAVAVGGNDGPAAQPGPAAASTQPSATAPSRSKPGSPPAAQPVQSLPAQNPAPEVSANPRIEANPDSGAVGSVITLTGSGFASGERVRVTFHGSYSADWDLRDVTASSEGGFVAEIKVPATYADDQQKSVEVRGLDSDKRADTPFTVTE
ncbi:MULTISPECIES: IPT/TIG domain-containing protein [Streptomyces]|uniref:IPT/TIG domain-containing protein n=1 Tax=Streptomyces TaxID=1883 RepID=UPI0021A2E4F6|nr:IPT/TIG domain-containing protein [Streptomyces atratus]MCT2541818.1 IPT/TIG domain-containing protein [Streptomyces atratus]